MAKRMCPFIFLAIAPMLDLGGCSDAKVFQSAQQEPAMEGNIHFHCLSTGGPPLNIVVNLAALHVTVDGGSAWQTNDPMKPLGYADKEFSIFGSFNFEQKVSVDHWTIIFGAFGETFSGPHGGYDAYDVFKLTRKTGELVESSNVGSESPRSWQCVAG